MARIRIVDEWLRSPVSAPSRLRAIMVVAESWSEQRVLMRAFAGSADQTRPTIVLHGAELAIGPAGVDAHGEWGIHVEPPADGRAQQLRSQLELAARRLAGSRGNPPRLEDEESSFERKATNNWAPGTPRNRRTLGLAGATPAPPDRYYEPAEVAPRVGSEPDPVDRTTVAARVVVGEPPPPAPRLAVSTRAPARSLQAPPTPPAMPAAPQRKKGKKGWTNPIPRAGSSVDRDVHKASTTVLGFASPKQPLGVARPGVIGKARSFASVVGHTMPLGFQLSDTERKVLNALGRSDGLSAAEVAAIAGVDDGVAWMDAVMAKLAEHGLDLVMPGDDRDGEPTYCLRR